MRKRIFGRKLSRSRKARKALLRSLTKALVKAGQIETTLAKAKFVKPFAEKLFFLGRKKTIEARRKILAELGNDRIIADKIVVLSQEFSKDNGFTRIIPLPARQGDNAPMARLEFAEKITDNQSKSESKKPAAKKDSEKKLAVKKSKTK